MRFNQSARGTIHFSEQIWVVCPNCNDIGLVETQLKAYSIPFPKDYSTKFKCLSCNLKKENSQEWFGYYQGRVYQACGFCGSRISYTSEPTKERCESAKVKCETCSKEREYELKVCRYRGDKPIDPFFGLELWLQTNIKSNVLWLYNLKQLKYLREYVEAKLRDDDERHKYSMISNLPQWMKSAKNRALIVRKLNRLETDLKNKMAIVAPTNTENTF